MAIFQTPFFQKQPTGEQLFTTVGTTNFIVPDDVYFISAVCVGGGGGGGNGAANDQTPGGGGGALAWVSNLPVRPGENLSVAVAIGGTGGQGAGTAGASRISRGATNLVVANGGANAPNTNSSILVAGGTFTFDASIIGVAGIGTGGGVGGTGGATATASVCGGGGGAGGYSGSGGAGGVGTNGDGASGTGGGGGGGEASTNANNQDAGGGGGVGLYGIGTNGEGGTGNVSDNGGGGSGGLNGNDGNNGSGGGLYGGGGGGANGTSAPGPGAQGAVRIMWGPNRAYESTNVSQDVVFLASSTSTLDTITIPSTAQAGDIAILFDAASNVSGTAPTSVDPSGWTNLASSSGTDGVTIAIRMNVSYHILDSNEAGTTITGMNGGTDYKSVLVFRPNFNCLSVTRSALGVQFTSADPTAQNITLVTGTPGVPPPIVAFAHMRSTGAVSRTVPSGWSEITNTNQIVQYFTNNPNDTNINQTVDMADTGFNGLTSFYLNFIGEYT